MIAWREDWGAGSDDWVGGVDGRVVGCGGGGGGCCDEVGAAVRSRLRDEAEAEEVWGRGQL